MSDATPPSSPNPESEPRPLRASDAEREQTVETLRRAMAEGRLNQAELEERLQSAYTVPTRGELEMLVSDVSAPGHWSPPVAQPQSGRGVVVREGPGGTRRVLSIMSGHDQKGRWRIGKRCTVLNVMGGSDLDLCDVELSDQVTQLSVYSVMGGGEIRVPDGLQVEVSQFAFMGGNEVRLGDEIVPPGGPVVRIRLVSIMGGTSVKRGRRLSKAERRRQKELRRAERRELDS